MKKMTKAKENMNDRYDKVWMQPDRWLSVDEIAGHLGIKRDTVYRWIVDRQMPGHKIGRLWKFKKEEVDEWVKSGEAGNNVQGQLP